MENNIEKIRHSLSHIMAEAVLEFWPKTKLGIGPAIENGFYYDFALPAEALREGGNDEFLQKIEAKMKELILHPPTGGQKFVKKNITKLAANRLFKNQPYKLELISDLSGKTVSIYTSGDFTDLCKGPHVNSTKEINPQTFKLTKIAGAYWKGSEKNKMLTRIYGVAFETKKEIDDYFKILQEAEKRDHRMLGEKLELFFMHETAPGMPYWLPKGVILYNELVNFWRQEHQKRDYQEIISPLLNKKELYEISGHWEHYKEDMFIAKTEEGETYGIKAMNCPNAMLVFGLKPRSYKDLPLRFSDVDPIHRNERSGTLSGLFRVRAFRQDDAHIFVRDDQIKEEYKNILEIIERFYSIFNMEYSFRLGTRPKNFMGDVKNWNKAEKELEKILKQSGKKYTILKGDGAFYGPKIDILMKDSLGREWQMGTVQLDFQMPKRFKLSYIDSKGKKQTPVAVHRVVYGSLERFIGILIEHYAGAFPVWLSPVQAIIIPISEKHEAYGRKIAGELALNNIRYETRYENETLGKKIRDAELQKIPYLLILGDKEISANSVSVRKRGKGDLGQMPMNNFLDKISQEIKSKK